MFGVRDRYCNPSHTDAKCEFLCAISMSLNDKGMSFKLLWVLNLYLHTSFQAGIHKKWWGEDFLLLGVYASKPLTYFCSTLHNGKNQSLGVPYAYIAYITANFQKTQYNVQSWLNPKRFWANCFSVTQRLNSTAGFPSFCFSAFFIHIFMSANLLFCIHLAPSSKISVNGFSANSTSEPYRLSHQSLTF